MNAPPETETIDPQWKTDVDAQIWGIRNRGGLVNEVRGLRKEFRDYRQEERERREREAKEKNRSSSALAFTLLSAFVAALALIVTLGLYIVTGVGG